MIASEQDARDAAEFRRVLASSLTTTEAAALCGMLPSSFRGAMTRERARGNDFRTASRPVVLWSEARLRWWISCGRPGRGRRTHESPRLHSGDGGPVGLGVGANGLVWLTARLR